MLLFAIILSRLVSKKLKDLGDDRFANLPLEIGDLEPRFHKMCLVLKYVAFTVPSLTSEMTQKY